MGKKHPTAIVLDVGALAAFERADERIRALLREALRTSCKLVVPAGVVGQAWRGGERQVLLSGLLRGPTTSVPALDHVLAEAAGILCGRAGTSDVIDASIVLTAKREHAPVITSDVEDIRRLDSTLTIHRI